jgi:hypothetical protein
MRAVTDGRSSFRQMRGYTAGILSVESWKGADMLSGSDLVRERRSVETRLRMTQCFTLKDKHLFTCGTVYLYILYIYIYIYICRYTSLFSKLPQTSVRLNRETSFSQIPLHLYYKQFQLHDRHLSIFLCRLVSDLSVTHVTKCIIDIINSWFVISNLFWQHVTCTSQNEKLLFHRT